MPKAKMLVKGDKKKGKMAKSQAQPSNPDEYLEAGVDFEEAGEKWRGGDAVKSTRFFLKAIACYEEALARFPQSFDLAYNKCRVQYEVTQYPKLLAQLPGTLIELLETALESSRYALALKQDNAEVIYTTAQVLSSLAEATTASPQSSTHQPLPLLEESLELFQGCLRLQEFLFTESQTQAQVAMEMNDLDTEEGGASLESESDPTTSSNNLPAEQEKQWASILEPVTKHTLIDTILAQLEVLTLVCGLPNNDPRILNFIEEYSSPLLKLKLPSYLKDLSPEIMTSASVTAATFISALSDANFLSGRSDAGTYFAAISSTWTCIDLSQTPEGLVSAAEAFISYNAALRNTSISDSNSSNSQSDLSTRWKALSSAQDYLAKVSKLPDVDKLAKIYLLRGDVDILRYQLGNGVHVFETARKSQVVLCRNAEKFYRGARGLAGAGGEMDLVNESSVKEGLAKAFVGDGSNGQALREVVKQVGELVARGLLVEGCEDGLVRIEQLEDWGL